MVTSAGLNVPYSYLYRKYINHIHLLFFLHPTPLVNALSLELPVLHHCTSLFIYLLTVQWDFCLGILPAHVLCLSQSKVNLPPSLPLSCVVQQFGKLALNHKVKLLSA
jgi:hypothetical protein